MTETPYQTPRQIEQRLDVRSWRGLRYLSLVPLIALFAILCAPFISIPIGVYHAHRERHRLLHETDHGALLQASRKLMKDFSGDDIDSPENDPRVPLIIRNLGPSHMTISTEQLRVELGGGFDHYGFIALPERMDGGDGWGKLIDGLYYYTE